MLDKTTGIPVIIVCLAVAVEIVVPDIQDDPKGCAVARMEVFIMFHERLRWQVYGKS